VGHLHDANVTRRIGEVERDSQKIRGDHLRPVGLVCEPGEHVFVAELVGFIGWLEIARGICSPAQR
jgi:hypothetical protein